jgi:hypothetical protein
MRARKLGTAMVVLTAGLAWGVPAAHAAAPSNDTRSGAVAINALPADVSADVREATTDSDDAALNAQCGAPATLGSVWYTLTVPENVSGLVLDVSSSDYSSGVIVAEPDGGTGWVVDACGPGTVGLSVYPGQQLTILAFNDTPGQTGGTLRLHAETATVPTVSVTVNPKGKVDRQGNALISGTVTCTDAQFTFLDTYVTQAVGRFAITGEGFSGSEGCTGGPQPWSTVVVPSNGKFAGGKAATFTFAFSCGSFFCADSYAEQVVRLSK